MPTEKASLFNPFTPEHEAFRAEPQRYDLLLIDQAMPDLTGTELAQEIRRLRPHVPIVLMSGYKGPQLTALARATGVGTGARAQGAGGLSRQRQAETEHDGSHR